MTEQLKPNLTEKVVLSCYLTAQQSMQRVCPQKALAAGWSIEQIRIFRPLAYLATPYSHPDKTIQYRRYREVTEATAWLMNHTGWNVLSPITHSHPIHVLGKNVRGDWEFWKKIDTEFLTLSHSIICFVTPGWTESTGVNCERAIGKEQGLLEFYLHKIGQHDYRLTKSEERPTVDTRNTDLDA